MKRLCGYAVMLAVAAITAPGFADEFQLMIGVDETLWPDQVRYVEPQSCGFPSCAGELYDGDRLAGNLPAGPVVTFKGTGTPMFAPNEFGSLSFTFRRGSVPVSGSRFPLQGIDFLGGPLLDLDGDANNGTRSLIPVSGQTPIALPGTTSFVDLSFDVDGGTVTLNQLDMTGTSEGGPGIVAAVATTVNVIAGTDTNGVVGSPINPSIDTRIGTVAAYVGLSGTLDGVYTIDGLGYEMWQDTLLAGSGTSPVLGTFQFLGTFEGWYVQRDPNTGQFPTLASEGLGTTLWPYVDVSQIGQVFNTANGVAGGSAIIATGMTGDDFAAAGNGGTGPTTLGDYFDDVVIPRIHPLSSGFVYLQGAGFGISNSGDPIYGDTVSYDLVIIAQAAPLIDGDYDRDGDVDLADFASMQRCWTGDGVAVTDTQCLVFDFDGEEDVDLDDYAAFEPLLVGPN